MKMLPLALLLGLGLPLFGQAPSLPSDASSLNAGEISERWNRPREEVSPTSRFSTRSIGASSAPRVSGVGMSTEAAEANAEALRALGTRGIRKLTGAAAAAAQRAQDARGSESLSQAKPAPDVFVELPFDESRMIAFRIGFKIDSTELADSASVALIDKAAEAMKQNPKLVFLLEGHTCDLGAVGYNQTLSERRALRVREWLIKHPHYPVPADRMLAVGRGMSRPLAANQDEASRAGNRRVMIGPVELADSTGGRQSTASKP